MYECEEDDGLAKVAKALNKIGTHIKYLGGGDNADSRGAVEFLGICLKEGLEDLASSIREHGRVVAESQDNCADAVRELNETVREKAEWLCSRGLRDVGTMIHDLGGDVRAAAGKDGADDGPGAAARCECGRGDAVKEKP